MRVCHWKMGDSTTPDCCTATIQGISFMHENGTERNAHQETIKKTPQTKAGYEN